jgi:transcriptional regulator with XRE-family HTH domain
MRGGLRVSEEDLAVGRRLAAMRKEAGLSQVEAGRRLGFAQSRIAKLEIGTRRLLFSEAIDMAELYGVTLMAFIPKDLDRAAKQAVPTIANPIADPQESEPETT